MTTVTMKLAERDCYCRMCDTLMQRHKDIIFKWYNGSTFILCPQCVGELRAMLEMKRLGATDLTVEVKRCL